MLDFKSLCQDAHQIAVDHGWWDKHRSFGEQIALMHSELSEALEAWRDPNASAFDVVNGKPEGWVVELADAVIRIMDTCEAHGEDLAEAIRVKMEYNRTRPYRHGGKRA